MGEVSSVFGGCFLLNSIEFSLQLNIQNRHRRGQVAVFGCQQASCAEHLDRQSNLSQGVRRTGAHITKQLVD